MDISEQSGADNVADASPPRMFALGQRVGVEHGSGGECFGVIVEDFGTYAGHGVEIGDAHIVAAARRWAIALDDGSLIFADTPDLFTDLSAPRSE